MRSQKGSVVPLLLVLLVLLFVGTAVYVRVNKRSAPPSNSIQAATNTASSGNAFGLTTTVTTPTAVGSASSKSVASVPPSTPAPGPSSTPQITDLIGKDYKGIYCLMPGDKAGQRIDLSKSTLWGDSFLTGMALRTQWNSVEPAKGQYNWSHFDQGLSLATANNKQISLSISAGALSPDWLFSENVQYLSLNIKTTFAAAQTVRMPLPWDATYQSEWGAFLQQFAARYDGDPHVSYIVIGGPGLANETYVAQDQQGVTDFTNAGGLPKWEQGAEAIIDLYARYFKKTPFVLAMGEPIKGPAGTQAIEDVVNYGMKIYPGRFGIENDGLSAVSNTGFYRDALISQYSATSPVGYQMVWSTNGPNAAMIKGTLDQAVANGYSLGGKWIEVYQEDCNKSQYQQMIGSYNAKLHS